MSRTTTRSLVHESSHRPSRDRALGGNATSQFAATPMREYTPASSLYAGRDSGDSYDHDDYDSLPTLRLALRGLNSALHAISCLLLLAIMAQFVDRARRRHVWLRYSEPQAVALIILLSADALLDGYTLATLRRHRYGRQPGVAVVGRLALGVAYIALFMVYVGMGAVFPEQYTFWGLARGLAGPVVYLFLWMIGVWNLLHVALHRHQVGQSIRTGIAAIGGWRGLWSNRGSRPEVQPPVYHPEVSRPAVTVRRSAAPSRLGMLPPPPSGESLQGLPTMRQALVEGAATTETLTAGLKPTGSSSASSSSTEAPAIETSNVADALK